MNLFTFFQNNSVEGEDNPVKKRLYKLLGWVIGLGGLFIITNLLFPTAVAIIINILWILLFVVVIVFFALGFLVVLGMKNEVSKILDIFLEGSMTIIDFVQFLKVVWTKFVSLLLEFLLYVAKLLAYVISVILYILLLILYKSVGLNHDVTIMSIIITFCVVFAFGLISKPSKVVQDLTQWKTRFKLSFKQGLIDGLEIVLFVFFLTMDSTNLFFLPQELNIPLGAKWGEFDLMVKSIDYTEHVRFTLNLITWAVTLEIVRNILRIVASARNYYANERALEREDESIVKKDFLSLVKISIRRSFHNSKDDLIKFIAFTSVLFFVFLFFPKLKLVTLLVASITNLTLDIIYRDRLTNEKGTDLISRVFGFVFKL